MEGSSSEEDEFSGNSEILSTDAKGLFEDSTTLKRPSEVVFPILNEGYLLLKQNIDSEGKRTEDRSWRKFYIVLQGPRLFLYKTEPKQHEQEIVGKIRLDPSCKLTEESEYKKKKNIFRIFLESKEEYFFQGKSLDEIQNWMEKIRLNSQLAPPNDAREVTEEAKAATISNSSKGDPNQSFSNLTIDDESEMNGFRKEKKSRLHFLKKFLQHRPTEEELKKKGILEGKNHKTVMSKPLFGVDLEYLQYKNQELKIPSIVFECIEILAQRSCENIVGIYRLSGNAGDIQKLKDLYDSFHTLDPADFLPFPDVHVVTGLLKLYFRSLPSGLLHCRIYDGLISAVKLESYEEMMYSIKDLIYSLPPEYFHTSKLFFQHLHQISQHGELNKMMADNLGIVFGPTLLRSMQETMQSMVVDMNYQCRVVSSIIQAFDWMFDQKYPPEIFLPSSTFSPSHPFDDLPSSADVKQDFAANGSSVENSTQPHIETATDPSTALNDLLDDQIPDSFHSDVLQPTHSVADDFPSPPSSNPSNLLEPSNRHPVMIFEPLADQETPTCPLDQNHHPTLHHTPTVISSSSSPSSPSNEDLFSNPNLFIQVNAANQAILTPHSEGQITPQSDFEEGQIMISSSSPHPISSLPSSSTSPSSRTISPSDISPSQNPDKTNSISDPSSDPILTFTSSDQVQN